MIRQHPAAAVAAVLTAAAAAASLAMEAGAAMGETPSLVRLFPREADVTVERPGLSRLVLPAEILSVCRPDLSDLRLFDASGGEVPFLLDTGRPAGARLEAVRRVASSPLEASRGESRSASGPPLRRESLTLPSPPPAPDDAPWDLVVSVRSAEFVARVRVEALHVDGGTASLIDGASLFRLGGARPSEKIRLPLPETRAPVSA